MRTTNYYNIHKWVNNTAGKANHCSNIECEGKSSHFEWALRKGFEHDYNTDNYIQLCKSCHVKYDNTGFKKGYKISGTHLKNLKESLKGRDVWNTGLTKGTNSKLMEISEKAKQRHENGEGIGMYGKIHSEETKRKMKESWAKKVADPEYRSNKHSEETKIKMKKTWERKRLERIGQILK